MRHLLFLMLAACGSDDSNRPTPDAGLDAAMPVEDAGDATAEDASMPPPDVRIDGAFDDWQGVAPIATDAAGDATGAFDLTVLQARSAGAVLQVRFDVGSVLNLNAGEGSEGTLVILVGLPGGEELAIDSRALDPRLDGRALIWEEIAYEAAPTHSSAEFEVAMDLSLLGVAAGETVTIDFGGSDALDEPASFALDGPERAVPRRSVEREPMTTVRIASLNVLKSGLLPGPRHDPIVRLLRAAAADVYCLQEEYDLTTDELVEVFGEVTGEAWDVHKVRDNVVASRWPITPIAGEHERYATVTADVDGRPLVVTGAHLSCCGWDGSIDDEYRIDEAGGIVRTIEGGGGGAPAVVIGDWNLVGSRAPLETVLDGIGLEHWLVPQLIGDHVMTWRSSVSFFPPGILDLVAHDPEGLVRRNGFILDTLRLTDEERAALGVEADDSLATDHLMVVVDFEMP